MSLYLEIVTPKGIVWQGDAIDAITLPTRGGQIQVLKGHIPILTALNAGEVVIKKGDVLEELVIDIGFARCMLDKVSILTQGALELDKLNEADIEKALEEAKKTIENAKNSKTDALDDLERLEAQMKFIMAQQVSKARKKK